MRKDTIEGDVSVEPSLLSNVQLRTPKGRCAHPFKGGLPLSRNWLYMRTQVNFTRANKIEAMLRAFILLHEIFSSI